MCGLVGSIVLDVLVERRPLRLLVFGRKQVVECLVTPDDQIGYVLLQLHHEVGNLAREGHRVHQDGLRKFSGFLDGGYRRTYQQTDPIRCSCHGVQTALTAAHVKAGAACGGLLFDRRGPIEPRWGHGTLCGSTRVAEWSAGLKTLNSRSDDIDDTFARPTDCEVVA